MADTEQSLSSSLQEIKTIAESMRDHDLMHRMHKVLQDVHRLIELNRTGMSFECHCCTDSLEILEGDEYDDA